jgi:hypothetical protein
VSSLGVPEISVLPPCPATALPGFSAPEIPGLKSVSSIHLSQEVHKPADNRHNRRNLQTTGNSRIAAGDVIR